MQLNEECKCGCHDFIIKQVGPHHGFYCSKCDRYLRWIRKSEKAKLNVKPDDVELTLTINGVPILRTVKVLDSSFGSFLGVLDSRFDSATLAEMCDDLQRRYSFKYLLKDDEADDDLPF